MIIYYSYFSHTNCFDGISIRAATASFGAYCHCESQFVIVSIILTPRAERYKKCTWNRKQRKKNVRYQSKQNDLTQIIGELCAYKLYLGPWIFIDWCERVCFFLIKRSFLFPFVFVFAFFFPSVCFICVYI